MLNYKIVACDMDGTLLDSNSEISSENLASIDLLCDMGVHFVPASGRTLSEIPKEVMSNPKIRYVIYSNGAAVIDRITGEKILMCIERNITTKIIDILKCYDIHIVFRHDGKLYVDSDFQSESDIEYYNLCGPHQGVIKNYGNKIKNLLEFAKTLDNIEVFAVFFHSNEEKEECRKKIEKIDNLRVVEPWDYSIEIFSQNAGKGNALKALSNSIGCDIKDTIAVGDSDNDASMIKTAGLGLAMANSCEDVKKIADCVICNNDEHAIKYILNIVFKGERL